MTQARSFFSFFCGICPVCGASLRQGNHTDQLWRRCRGQKMWRNTAFGEVIDETTGQKCTAFKQAVFEMCWQSLSNSCLLCPLSRDRPACLPRTSAPTPTDPDKIHCLTTTQRTCLQVKSVARLAGTCSLFLRYKPVHERDILKVFGSQRLWLKALPHPLMLHTSLWLAGIRCGYMISMLVPGLS